MWKNIPIFGGKYSINEHGDVKNNKTGKMVKGDLNSTGYPRVTLYNNGKYKRVFRHRMVAELFIPNPLNLPEVNHKDGNILNPDISNLEWTTKIENELHSLFYGRKKYKPFKVVWEDGAEEIFHTRRHLAIRLNVTKGLIRMWLHKELIPNKKYKIKSIDYCDR